MRQLQTHFLFRFHFCVGFIFESGFVWTTPNHPVVTSPSLCLHWFIIICMCCEADAFDMAEYKGSWVKCVDWWLFFLNDPWQKTRYVFLVSDLRHSTWIRLYEIDLIYHLPCQVQTNLTRQNETAHIEEPKYLCGECLSEFYIKQDLNRYKILDPAYFCAECTSQLFFLCSFHGFSWIDIMMILLYWVDIYALCNWNWKSSDLNVIHLT